ncbi:MAG TPA: imidazole glycerol phosphate synthase subunit HisH [Opitutaceae bacterium]
MLAIVDSGGANIASVRFALARLGVESVLTTDLATIRSAERVILPGVGSAAEGMRRLQERGLVDTVRSLTQPTLGICLGMQLLFDGSEEGPTETLGLIAGRVSLLPASSGVRVPHMGWNTIEAATQSALLEGIDATARFYFVHSFAAPTGPFTVATTTHGTGFSAVVRRDNFHGVQFHPERSGTAGACILKNFLEAKL